MRRPSASYLGGVDEPVAGGASQRVLAQGSAVQRERAAEGDLDEATLCVVLVEAVVVEDQVAASVIG